MSADGRLENEADTLGLIGTSSAVINAKIPFGGPVGIVRVGKIDGAFAVNPTNTQMKTSTMELVVVYTKKGVIMIEAGAKELPEAEMLAAIKFAEAPCMEIIKAQEELASKVKSIQKNFTIFTPDAEIVKAVKVIAGEKFGKLSTVADKILRIEQEGIARQETRDEALVKFPEKARDIAHGLEDFEYERLRNDILVKGVRPDGRGVKEIREISCETGLLPRTHGSGLFQRGQTQALVVVTLGTKEDAQIMDELIGESKKKYMLHYNFPQFATGEVRPSRGVGRREIGHGALA